MVDADDVRDRLLQGYEYIFMEEYQDIDEQQYALVSGLAGRRRADADTKLSIMAGRLASSTDEVPLQAGDAHVVAVMMRTRSQTPESYWESLPMDQWETPLLEIELRAGNASMDQ